MRTTLPPILLQIRIPQPAIKKSRPRLPRWVSRPALFETLCAASLRLSRLFTRARSPPGPPPPEEVAVGKGEVIKARFVNHVESPFGRFGPPRGEAARPY